MTFSFRIAQPRDYLSIADIHARSWKDNYRGILSDDYLDHQVDQDRRQLWQTRLNDKNPNQLIIVATEREQIVGFACAYAHHDETGHYLDNLHVRSGYQGNKVGRTLMHHIASQINAIDESKPLYLWVFAQNERALKIYQEWGGANEKTEYLNISCSVGGGMAIQIIWTDLSDLLMENVPTLTKGIPQPIACELYDHFEIAAMRRTPVIIKLRQGAPDIHTTIKTLQTRDKIEYLITREGQEIGLHDIQSMQDQNGDLIVDLDQSISC